MISEHASPLATIGGVDAGGQNVHVAALAQAIAAEGNDVVVYTRRSDVRVAKRVTMGERVTVVHVPAGPPRTIAKDEIWRHMDAFAAWTIDDCRNGMPEVLHAHFWMSGYAALAVRAALGVPVVHTFHALAAEKRSFQGAADTSPGERIAVEEHIARSADRIVATATAEAFTLIRMGARPTHIKVIPCGVDLAHFTRGGPVEARGGAFRIVTLSRLVPRKGIADVIEALAAVPDAELIVAGGPEAAELANDPEARRLAAVAREYGVARRVFFRGGIRRAQVPQLLRSADVVVCAPWYEPFGIVPLEAMACGIPVIASAVGGLVDTVVDGMTGIHVKPRMPAEIASALRLLQTDRTLHASFAAAGVARVRSFNAWERIASRTLAVYQSTLVAKRREATA